jgi:hypothetical protein
MYDNIGAGIGQAKHPYEKGKHMKQVMLAIMLLVAVALSGCSSSAGSAGLGALGGAAAGVAGYEYNAHRQMEQLEEDYREGRINRREYQIRRDQIQKGSILK